MRKVFIGIAALRMTWLGRAGSCIAVVVLLILSGCATPYRPMRSGTGYADSQAAPDRFEVSFQGNGHNTSRQVSDFALLRAAQLTLEHGFSCFALLDITNTSSATTYLARQQYYSDYPPNIALPPPTPGGVDPYRFGYIVEYDQPEIYFRPGTRFLIQCFKTRPEHPFTYDAAQIEQSLKREYKLR